MTRHLLASLLLLGLLLLPGLPAHAQRPDRGGPPDWNNQPDRGWPSDRGGPPDRSDLPAVRDLALQISANAALLSDVARRQFDQPNRYQQVALMRFERLRARAEDYTRATNQFPGRPRRTNDQYVNLRDAWRDAQASIGSVRPTADASRAIGRVRNGMAQLSRYYLANAPDNEPAAGRLDYVELHRTARAIEDRAEDALARARKLSHVGEEKRRALDRLADAAENFTRQIEKYHGNIGHIDEEYIALARCLREARERAEAYDREIRGNLISIQTQVNRLDYLHPGTAIYDRPGGR